MYHLIPLCDQVCQIFSGYSAFPHQKTNHHDITEILLKVALNTINQTKLNSKYKKKISIQILEPKSLSLLIQIKIQIILFELIIT
jgi:hypothetical protein